MASLNKNNKILIVSHYNDSNSRLVSFFLFKHWEFCTLIHLIFIKLSLSKKNHSRLWNIATNNIHKAQVLSLDGRGKKFSK